MMVDWDAFTPWSALAGGALIGLAAGMFALLNGRIAGISGIVGGLLGRRVAGDSAWRVAFIAGMMAAPLAWLAVAAPLPIHIDAGWATVIAGGFLVGLATRHGSGCTSGHGVCGVARLSPRSLVATAVFMTSGFATVFALRHLIGGG